MKSYEGDSYNQKDIKTKSPKHRFSAQSEEWAVNRRTALRETITEVRTENPEVL